MGRGLAVKIWCNEIVSRSAKGRAEARRLLKERINSHCFSIYLSLVTSMLLRIWRYLSSLSLMFSVWASRGEKEEESQISRAALQRPSPRPKRKRNENEKEREREKEREIERETKKKEKEKTKMKEQTINRQRPPAGCFWGWGRGRCKPGNCERAYYMRLMWSSLTLF